MFYPAPSRYSSEDLAIIEARADQGRTFPYWPFPALTPMQAAQRARQEAAMRQAAQGARS